MAFVCPRRALLAVLLPVFCAAALASDYGKVTANKVADGVYQFSVSGYGDVGMSGNSVAIIGDDGVLIFDTTGTPSSARFILAELKKITNRPVRYVVNSHWHWDHWGGNEVFRSAFSNVQIISQEKTRAMMMSDAVDWNRDYLATIIPEHINEVATAAKKAGSSADRARLLELAIADRTFLREKRTLTNTFPNQVFSDSMTIFLGHREIQLSHTRAITPGDAFAYLPKEKILLTGDILVHPIPFAIGGTYPSAWLESLHRLKALDPLIIVPGHGPAEQDHGFLDANLKLFQRVLEDVKHAKASGLSLEQTTAQLERNVAAYAALIGAGEKSYDAVQGLFLHGFIKNAYLEIDHPISDKPEH
jgi:cyclase